MDRGRKEEKALNCSLVVLGRMDAELEGFTKINLADFLQGQEGWAKDKAGSTRHSIKLRKGAEILIVNPQPSGVWLYFNPHDDGDKGTIIHYLQNRRGAGYTLGHVRKELRGAPLPSPSTPAWQPPERESTPEDARRRWESSALVGRMPDYLAARGLHAATVKAFASSMRIDRKGAVLFGHTDEAGIITGYEIHSPTFKGFSKGGDRHLCRFGPGDGVPLGKIALCESGIDALSLAQMAPRRDALYASTGGVVGPHAVETIKGLAELNPRAEIVLSFDNDREGDRYSQTLKEALAGHPGGVRRLQPSCKDWNDVLQRRCHPAILPSFNP